MRGYCSLVPPRGVFMLFLRENPETAVQEFEELFCIKLLVME